MASGWDENEVQHPEGVDVPTWALLGWMWKSLTDNLQVLSEHCGGVLSQRMGWWRWVGVDGGSPPALSSLRMSFTHPRHPKSAASDPNPSRRAASEAARMTWQWYIYYNYHLPSQRRERKKKKKNRWIICFEGVMEWKQERSLSLNLWITYGLPPFVQLLRLGLSFSPVGGVIKGAELGTRGLDSVWLCVSPAGRATGAGMPLCGQVGRVMCRAWQILPLVRKKKKKK